MKTFSTTRSPRSLPETHRNASVERRDLSSAPENPGNQICLSEGRHRRLDGQCGGLKGAKNLDNAKLFQDFIMAPENAALISEFAGYANVIAGSHKFLPADFAASPEINPPPVPGGGVRSACPPDVCEIYNKIWTNLRK